MALLRSRHGQLLLVVGPAVREALRHRGIDPRVESSPRLSLLVLLEPEPTGPRCFLPSSLSPQAAVACFHLTSIQTPSPKEGSSNCQRHRIRKRLFHGETNNPLLPSPGKPSLTTCAHLSWYRHDSDHFLPHLVTLLRRGSAQIIQTFATSRHTASLIGETRTHRIASRTRHVGHVEPAA